MAKGQFIQGYKGIYMIFAIIMLAFMFLYLHKAFTEFQTVKTQCTETVTNEIMLAKILYSPCLTYYDPSLERSIPGTIDMSKFSNETLQTCFTYLTKKVQLKINDKTIGEKGYSQQTINKLIYIYDQGKTQTATLQFITEVPPC